MSLRQNFLVRAARRRQGAVMIVLCLFNFAISVTAMASENAGICIISSSNSQPMAAPVITNCPQFSFQGYLCNEIRWDFDASPALGCNDLTWTVSVSNPQPVGDFTIDENGLFSFTFDLHDAASLFQFLVIVSDNCGGSDSCTIVAESVNSRPHLFKIGMESGIYGNYINLPILKLAGSDQMVGFDFAISYDPCILNFISAALGPALGVDGCGWEYFTYRPSYDGPANTRCSSGSIRLKAVADINNGEIIPLCNSVPDGTPLAVLRFAISHNHAYDCQTVPVRFAWHDCIDNTFRSLYYDDFNISCRVFDYGNTDPNTDPNHDLTDLDCSQVWHYGGSCGACDTIADLWPRRFELFWNGGVDIMCADSDGCIRGDLNLNLTAYEIGDLGVYLNFWFWGLPAFTISQPAQICTSDINDDGYYPDFGDLVYMLRIMSGEALPIIPKSAAISLASIEQHNNIIELESESDVGGIMLDLRSPSNKPVVLNNLSDFELRQERLNDGSIRVLLLPPLSRLDARLHSGQTELIAIEGEVDITNLVIVDYYGNSLQAQVGAPELPLTFSLHQNTPNPFNPTTKIGLDLPTASDWTLSIYNVAGQLVKSFNGRGVGTINVEWDATNAASGVYFYIASADGHTASRKMLLLK